MPPGCQLRVVIDEVSQPVCCHGCQAVAAMIAGADMTAFYQQRTGFGPRVDPVDPKVVDWFRDETWVATYTHRDGDTLVLPLMVSGMSCAACTWIVERFLEELPEVESVDVNLTLGRVVLRIAGDQDPARSVEKLLSLGYGVRPWRTDERLERMRDESRRDLRRLGVAGLGMMQVGMFAIALHAGDLQGIDTDMQQLLRGFSAPLTLFVLAYSGRSFFINAWHHLRQGALIMDSSVSLALILATGASLWATLKGGGDTYFDSVTMFIFFLLLARFVEQRLRNADLIALVRLEDGLPEFVNALRDGQWERLPRDHVVPNDTLRVAAGDAFAFDGEVVSGRSAVEEAVFTGEALPRTVKAGDSVFAGTVNREASLDVRVTSEYRDSRLAALAEDVDSARQSKPEYLQLIDRIAARFVGFVLLCAAATGGIWLTIDPDRALWSALSVLVIACPCALSLATPAALAAATAALRRQGVLVRGEFGLLAAAEADAVLIDKTGTLTQTGLAVDQVVTAEGMDPQRALGLAAAMQLFSNHPAAKAFHSVAADPHLERVTVEPGKGLEARWNESGDGVGVRLGSDTYCRDLAPNLPREPDTPYYWIALVAEGKWLAWIGLSERLRPGAAKALTELKAMGLTPRLVSGDSSARVSVIANSLDVTYAAAQTPAQKLSELQTLQRQGQTVIAVGDGLNDAPLLGAADASVAVAGATALTSAQADFAITDDNLEQLSGIVTIARRARRVIRQNLAWAASYNLLGIPFAALGYVPPWMAALGMSLSSLLVVLNALRLRRRPRAAATPLQIVEAVS